MSLTNFDNVKAAEIQPLLDQKWKDPQFAKSYKPKANTLKAILENQTATLQELETPDKKREVSLKWVDFCGDTSSDTTDADDCNNAACGEGTAKKQDLALDIFIKDCYSVSSEELESSVVGYNDIVATGLAAKIKNIVEKFNNKAVAVIAANKGVNPFAGAYTVNATSKNTYIPDADYGAEKIIPYLMQVMEMNRSQETFLLDGGNLFQDFDLAGKKQANADGKLESELYSDMPYRHDLPGFAANSLSAYDFLIDRGALAIANRAKFPALSQLASMKDGGWIHTSTGNLMRYSIPVNIPDLMPMTFVRQGAFKKQNLMIDVQYSVVCGEDGILKPTWSLKLRAGVFANPLRCLSGNTGILSFVKGTDPDAV
jgi:hypothetical protein